MCKFILKKCEECGNLMKIKINNKKGSKNYGKIIKIHQKKRFCSTKCQNEWQKSTKWEERVGVDTAERIRQQTSERVKGDKNPSKNPSVSGKISKSLKEHLKENPRIGDKNPMFGKKHTDEFIHWASESRKGKRSYDEDGYKKQNENTLKGEEHPNWLGGISNGEYPFEFSKTLKKEIKTRDGYICMICGKKTQKLAIHHIDYNKSNTNKHNLISLCISCHSITNYNREHWKLFLNNIIKEKYNKEK